MLTILFALTALCTILFVLKRRYRSTAPAPPSTALDQTIIVPPEIKKPISVNYHFSRVCNYKCGFCFHTQTNNFQLPLKEALRGIKLLHEAGTKKINFAGGEPFLSAKLLGQMCKFSKELGMAVSIVSNGSKIKKDWFATWGQYLDILAISCDSFDEATNIKIGRGNGQHVAQVYNVAQWCREYGIKFKLNSVICSYNHAEDMNEHIRALAPFRWKVFQVLLIDGENVGSNETNKDAKHLLITKAQFDAFTARHAAQQCLVAESNELMKDSYLILDERMRFLNCQNGKKEPSQSILEVPVEVALSQSGFDSESFVQRQGIYDWGRDVEAQPACATAAMRDIEDL